MNKTKTPLKYAGSQKEGTSENEDMGTWLLIGAWVLIKWTFTLGIAAAKSNWSLPSDEEALELAAAVPVDSERYPFVSLEGNTRAKSWLGWGLAVAFPYAALTFMAWPLILIGWGVSFWLYRPWARACYVEHLLVAREDRTMDPRDEIRFDDLRHRAQSDAAKAAVVGLPATINGSDGSTVPLLGTIVRDVNKSKQDLLEDWKADLRCIDKNATGLTLPSTPPHWIMVGESGSGKTESMKRIASAALEEDAVVFFIDAKGDSKTALEFQAIVEGAGKRVALWPDIAFDIFRGKRAEIKDRLEAMICTQEEGSAASYYDELSRLLLHAVCFRPSGCPRNFDDLLEGIRTADKTGEPQSAEQIREKLSTPRGKQELQGTVLRVQNLRVQLAQLGGVDNAGGQRDSWSWDGICRIDPKTGQQTNVPIDAGYVRIQTASNTGAAKGMARAILKDFDQWKHTDLGERLEKDGTYPYAEHRYKSPRPIYLFLDEFSALSGAAGETLQLLLEQSRSVGVRVFISVQSYIGLGSGADERRLLTEAGVGFWAHRISNPQEFIDLIGTEQTVETGHQGGSDGLTGTTSMRRQPAYAVNPEDLKSLGVGEAIIGKAGVAVHVQVAQAVVPGTSVKAREVDQFSPELVDYANRINAVRAEEAQRAERSTRQARKVERAVPLSPESQPIVKNLTADQLRAASKVRKAGPIADDL